jgi:hypothetical protein
VVRWSDLRTGFGLNTWPWLTGWCLMDPAEYKGIPLNIS